MANSEKPKAASAAEFRPVGTGKHQRWHGAGSPPPADVDEAVAAVYKAGASVAVVMTTGLAGVTLPAPDRAGTVDAAAWDVVGYDYTLGGQSPSPLPDALVGIIRSSAASFFELRSKDEATTSALRALLDGRPKKAKPQ